MEKIIDKVRAKKKLFWFITLGYLIFFGCFSFPLRWNAGVLNLYLVAMTMVAYVILGIFFIGLLGKSSGKAYGLTLGFTVLGLVCRYLLEFGEVSNTVNFTLVNICIYLAVMPPITMLAYFGMSYKMDSKA